MSGWPAFAVIVGGMMLLVVAGFIHDWMFPALRQDQCIPSQRLTVKHRDNGVTFDNRARMIRQRSRGW